MKDKPREKALQILKRAEEGAFADMLLDEARQKFDPRDRAFVTEIVYGVLRNRARLDWTLNRFSAQPISQTDGWTRNVLRLAAYQMLFLDKVPVSAAVNTAAELAKEHGKKSGFVNGLLRNLDRKRVSLPSTISEDPVENLSILYSHPAWLVRRWTARLGLKTAEIILRGNNEPAPLTVRTNTLRTTRQDLLSKLRSEGSEAVETRWSESGIDILSSSGLRSLGSYQNGLFMVQDQAAQLVSLILDPHPGEKVLDACSAPGGKATHLAELMENKGSVTALDIEADRIAKINENSARLGVTIITTVRGDAARYREGGLFDKILIDAPCSGLGVLRRHPDGRWNKSEQVIRERAQLQARILGNCASLLKPGGALVYATCTTEPEENEDVIFSFLDRPEAFRIDDSRPFLPREAASLVDSQGFFRTFPKEPVMDGFFAVRLIKNK